MASSSSRNLIVHVQSIHLINSYNVDTKQTKEHEKLPKFTGNFSKFFGQLQSMFNLNQVKAIAFDIIGFEFSKFIEFYEFRLKCNEFCQKHQIFCLFPYSVLIQASITISQTKTMVKEGEKVMIFLVDYHGSHVPGLALIRKTNCYQLITYRYSRYPPFTQQWQEDMFEGLNPKKVFLQQGPGSENLKKAQEFFKSYNPVVINHEDIATRYMGSIVDKVLQLTGEIINIYDIESPCLARYEVKYYGKSLIKVTEFDIAPFEKSVIIDVVPKMSVSLYCSYPVINPPELIEEIKLSTFESKKVKVTLKLDVNFFYEFKVEPFDGNKEETKKNVAKENEENLAAKPCEEKEPEVNVDESPSDKRVEPDKARMVFDKHNFSVSYFAAGKEYNLNGSDGQIKTPIYISFHEKKPIIGKAAVEIYSAIPKFVVFDLIKLCSVTADDIINPKWGFRLSKEAESLIVIMETYDDEKKSTVEFLLAIILKAGKDRIKKETGKRMEEVEIKFDGFSPNEILKKNFVEAGKLLKINIVFV